MTADTTILSVGQCRPDQAAISHFLISNFSARVLTADTAAHVMPILKQHSVDLVIVNRILDADGDDGMAIIRDILATPDVSHIPVMLVSNFAEWQEKAEAVGAMPGFGKAELSNARTRERISAALSRADKQPAKPH